MDAYLHVGIYVGIYKIRIWWAGGRGRRQTALLCVLLSMNVGVCVCEGWSWGLEPFIFGLFLRWWEPAEEWGKHCFYRIDGQSRCLRTNEWIPSTSTLSPEGSLRSGHLSWKEFTEEVNGRGKCSWIQNGYSQSKAIYIRSEQGKCCALC